MTSPASVPRSRGVWWGEVVGAIVLGTLLVVVAGTASLYVLSGTDWGRERIRREAVAVLQRHIHGRVQIGRVSGNLVSGFTVHDFVLTDTAGQPFIAVPVMRGDYGLGDLLHKRVWVDNLILERPMVYLDRRQTTGWNWKRIFPRDTTPKPARAQTGWLDRVRFTNVRIVNGTMVVRTPWHPSHLLSPAASDSAIREAVSGRARLVVERVPDGYQKIAVLKAVTARLPLLRLSEPGYTERLARVAALRMDAYMFHPPATEVRGFSGDVPFTDDSVWWRGATGRLPHSVATGDGTYKFKSGDLHLTAHANPAVLADFRWLYPRLPAEARGSMDFDLSWTDAVEEYRATNLKLADGAATIAGSLGLTRGDSVTFHDTDLRFANVDTRLIEQAVEGFESPRRGTLSGRAAVSGGRNALDVNADVRFADATAGTSRIAAAGRIGFPGRGVRATNLRLTLEPVQVELVRRMAPTLPISGIVTGTAVLNGSTATTLHVAANLEHVDRGLRSHIAGTGAVQLVGQRPTMDITATAEPISLAEVGRFAPAIGLQGFGSGPIRIVGSASNLSVTTDLRVTGGGRIAGRATLALGVTPRYDVAASLYTLNLHAIVAKAPETSLSALATVHGSGKALATMNTAVAADFSTSRWDSVAIDTASLRVAVGNGLLDVHRLMLQGGHATANASGQFGVAPGRLGELTYHVAADSLGAFNRWIPGARDDSTLVGPRPGLVSRALQTARTDSARIARATEIERIVTGKAPPTLDVKLPKSVRRDTIGGTAYAAGTLTGNIDDFTLRGRAGGDDVVARGHAIHKLWVDYAWARARTPDATLAIGIVADSAMVGGFALDSVAVRLSYRQPGGHVDVLVRQDSRRDYTLTGDYQVAAERNELRIADLRVRLDTALWTATRPATIHWGGPGIEVAQLELRNRSNGRVYANGLLPTSGVANFVLQVDNFPVGNLTDLLESDVQLGGLITLSGAMSGTLADPTFRGAFGVVRGEYDGTPLPDLRGRLSYANRELVTRIDADRNGGRAVASFEGRIPIDLAFGGGARQRLLDAPMSIDLVGDSLPVELIPHFTDLVSDVHGRVAGSVSVRGTLDRPALTGAVAISGTSLTVNASGMRVYDLHGRITMANDVVTFGSEQEPLAGDAKGPVAMRGTINVGSWRDPAFDLYLYADHAEVMNNKYGTISADVGLALKGAITDPYLSGGVTIVEGVIRAPEATGKHVIGAGDPALFNVLDTALVAERELFPMHSPLLRNLRIDATVDIERNTWVRNRDANVEIYTEYPLRVHVREEAVSLTGVVTTDRGDYKFLSKRFAIARGSAMFIGSRDLNPTLQVTGEYAVQQPGAPALAVKVLIGGTLRRPRLSLESDAQPPRSQSELLSLLAFGQSSTSLLSLQGSSLAQNGTVGDFLNVGASRLTTVAMSVAIDQLEYEAGKKLGTDYFNITPGDVPVELLNSKTVFSQTRIEGGKYVTPNTFVVGQMMGTYPGFRVQYRASEGWRYEASTEPRFLLLPPTLSLQDYRIRQAYGAFVIREWRF